jgi:RNA polymerase sigma-70 factor (ECF subfamily)
MKQAEGFFGMLADEAITIRRAQNGDGTALEELLLAYEKKVYSIAYRLMGSEADAADMAQESLIKIYRSTRGFKGEASFSSWVYRLTVNTCMDGLRRRKRAPISLEYACESGMPFEDTAAGTPETHALSLERSEDIHKAIGMLSAEHKAVVVLRDITGLSYEEISDSLKISVGTVKSRISRGRQRLKELLLEG